MLHKLSKFGKPRIFESFLTCFLHASDGPHVLQQEIKAIYQNFNLSAALKKELPRVPFTQPPLSQLTFSVSLVCLMAARSASVNLTEPFGLSGAADSPSPLELVPTSAIVCRQSRTRVPSVPPCAVRMETVWSATQPPPGFTV